MTEAVEFFRKWGHAHLCAIPLDGGRVVAKHCRTARDIGDFLGQAGCNFYFSVNKPARVLDKKLTKRDIANVTYLHADLDPRPDKPFAQERERLLRLAQEPNGLPAPHIIIDSGGGYQLFWKLDAPLENDVGESVNKLVGKKLGADNCWNCDRVMRVPFTTNIPDERKRARGRTEAQTALVSAVWEAAVSADEVIVSAMGGRARELVAEQVGDYESRSERLFAFCAQAQRDGIPTDLLQRILINPAYPISSSVLDKPHPRQYAARQITRTAPTSKDDNVSSMNVRYAVIEEAGGKCRVLIDDDNFRPNFLSFDDLGRVFMNSRIGETTLAKLWLSHTDRRQYRSIVFDPSLPTGGTIQNGVAVFNRWGGWKVEPVAGEGHARLLEHIQENVCGGVQEHFDYVWGWLARMAQKPHLPAATALVLQGTTGIGKTFLAEVLTHILGRHALIVSNSEHLVGRFNAHLGELVLLVAEEAFFAGDKRHEGALKTLITGRTLALERKGFDVVNTPNRLHLLLTSNEDWVVPVGVADRRFAVFQVGKKRRRDVEYFGGIERALRAGGYASFLHALLQHDISGFNPLGIPDTAARAKQFERTLEIDRRWWSDVLSAGGIRRVEGSGGDDGWGGESTKNAGVVWETDPNLQGLYNNFTDAAATARRQRLPFFGEWFSRWQEALPNGIYRPPLELEACREAFRVFIQGVQK